MTALKDQCTPNGESTVSSEVVVPTNFEGRFHGGASTGPKTPEGRQRCAEAKTIHGTETRKARSNRAAAMRRLRQLEELGHDLGIMHGARMPGRKPLSDGD